MARTYAYLDTMAQWIKATENDPATNGQFLPPEISRKILKSVGAIVGIELINEALAAQLPGGLQQLKNYYLQGYNVVRQYLPAQNYYVVIETGFLHTVSVLKIEWGLMYVPGMAGIHAFTSVPERHSRHPSVPMFR